MSNLYRDRSGNIHAPREDSVQRDRSGVFAVMLAKGRLLVSWPSHQPHRAELPGGGIEAGESLDQALIREIREETSVELAAIRADRMVHRTVHFYAEEQDEFWDYDQIYKVIDPSLCESHLFDGRRRTVENGFASWERLEDIGAENMHVVHYDVLREMKIL